MVRLVRLPENGTLQDNAHALPLDHHRELELTAGLWAWLQENAAFLEATFA